MGVKFEQSRETIHLAVELIDRYYLKMSQNLDINMFKSQFINKKAVILH